MSGKFIVIAIGMVIGLALTPVISSQVSLIATSTAVSSTNPYGVGATGVAAGIRSLVELVPLGYVAAILLTPVYFMFKNRNGNGNGM